MHTVFILSVLNILIRSQETPKKVKRQSYYYFFILLFLLTTVFTVNTQLYDYNYNSPKQNIWVWPAKPLHTQFFLIVMGKARRVMGVLRSLKKLHFTCSENI